MKSELALAFNEVIENNKLKREIIIDALENALVTAYRKSVNASAAQHVVAKVDLNTGLVKIYAEKEVVDSIIEPNTEVMLDAAREVDPGAQLGDIVTVESTPKDFGRIAATNATIPVFTPSVILLSYCYRRHTADATRRDGVVPCACPTLNSCATSGSAGCCRRHVCFLSLCSRRGLSPNFWNG